MSIHVRLAAFRNSLGVSQVEFAKKIGLSQSTYKNYETGARKVPVPVLTSLLDNYALDIQWLLTGDKSELSKNDFQYLEDIVVAVMNFNEVEQLRLSSDKIGKLISMIFASYLKNGMINEDDIKSLMELAA